MNNKQSPEKYRELPKANARTSAHARAQKGTQFEWLKKMHKQGKMTY